MKSRPLNADTNSSAIHFAIRIIDRHEKMLVNDNLAIKAKTLAM